jgi:hypothetical protein
VNHAYINEYLEFYIYTREREEERFIFALVDYIMMNKHLGRNLKQTKKKKMKIF